MIQKMKPSSFIEASSTNEIDIEQVANETFYLNNGVVQNISWSNVTVTVPDTLTKQPKNILSTVDGFVAAGEIMALMGPSGCGKTSLLNVLAQRETSANTQVSSTVLLNGRIPHQLTFRRLSSYVESEDALIGSLTVKETLLFAAQLSLSGSVSTADYIRRVDKLLQAFGLTNQANTLVGTLLKKGISTGQKRRLSIASQLISAPKVLFLDEPTSGLDSAASFKVMSYVRAVAKANKLIVIAAIHQPSTMTFELFDRLLLLSEGKVCFCNSTTKIKPYFDSIGYVMPIQTNPAEFLLNLTNIDFDDDHNERQSKIARIQESWESARLAEQSKRNEETNRDLNMTLGDDNDVDGYSLIKADSRLSGRFLTTTAILLRRSWLKSRRDAIVYGVRFAMYLGLAILMGTVWLRLPATQSSMQPFANCILFGSAFMSFMAVVYVPAFLEDRTVYVKDRSNGLYGPTAFMVSNFLMGLPFLFVIALASSAFVYWMTGFRPSGTAFLTWVMWMYLNLVAAESLVVLMASLFPHFVVALALTAFANGIWMSCNGFMVPPNMLNAFYRYVFYYINYQAYVFQGLVVNEFGYRTYSCGDGCHCMYATALEDQCLNDGASVLEQYGYSVKGESMWVGIVLVIILVFRLVGWVAMKFKK